MPFQGLNSIKNPDATALNTTAGVAANSGFASPLLMGLLGQQTAQAQQTQTKMNDQQAAWATLDSAMKMAETDPLAANKILEAEAKANPAMKTIVDSGMRFSGRAKKPWYLITNQKTGETIWANIDLWLADGAPKNEEGGIPDKYKTVVQMGKEGGDGKYKKGGRYDYIGKKGEERQGTFQGYDDNNEPVWSDDVAKAHQTGDKSGTPRTVAAVRKDIRATVNSIASKTQSKSMLMAVLESSDNPKAQKMAAMMGKNVDPELQELRDLLVDYKEELKRLTGEDVDVKDLAGDLLKEGGAKYTDQSGEVVGIESESQQMSIDPKLQPTVGDYLGSPAPTKPAAEKPSRPKITAQQAREELKRRSKKLPTASRS